MNPSPAGTPEDSPAIHRWVIRPIRNESRQGRKNTLVGCTAFFRPLWGSLVFCVQNPRLKPWAIVTMSLRDNVVVEFREKLLVELPNGRSASALIESPASDLPLCPAASPPP